MLSAQQGSIGLRARVAELASTSNGRTLVIGVAAVAVTPIVLPLIKPVLRATVKTGVKLYEQTKVAIAETGEFLADVAAEARAEIQTTSQKQASLPTVNSASQATTAE